LKIYRTGITTCFNAKQKSAKYLNSTFFIQTEITDMLCYSTLLTAAC